MKKFMLFMFILVLLVGIISAFEFDNVQDYNSDKKEYTITNALGIPFFGKEIAKIKLNTPLNYEVPIGYQKVAEFTVENYDDYVNVFNDMEFYNTKKSNELFVRDFDYKYKTIIQVPKYKHSCEDDGDNKTAIECTKTQIGFKDKVTWTEINKETGLLKGNITIGVFTEVMEGDKVEWIATLFGERLGEWSVWTASLNVDLIAYWTLDDVYTDSSIFSNTLTPINSTTFNTGIINNGSDFESGSSQYLTRTAGSLYPEIPFTLNMWVKPESVTADAVVINKRSDATGRVRYNIFRSGTSDRVSSQHYRADATNFVVQSDAGALVIGNWTMVTIVLDGIDARLYVNGSLAATPVAISDLHNVAEQAFFMGSNIGVGQFWDGIIDETSMWNRSLSPAEIIQLYNNGLAIQHTNVFVPVVTLNSPVNEFNTTNSTIDFNATISNTVVLANVSLFIDGILNETNSSGINSTNYLFTKNIAEGSHNWTYEVCDNIGCGTGTIRNFTIDSSPKINVTSPTNITFQDPTIFFNATTSLGVDNFIINYNGTNVTIAINTSLIVEDGFHNLLLYANNSNTGKFGLNDTIFFTVDTAPVINVNSPTNITHTTSTIFFNATTNKTIGSWIVNYNGTNVTLSDINTTLEVEDGSTFQLLLYANNSVSGAFGLNDTIFFSVDATAPQITVTFPNETINFHEVNTNIFVNWTVFDTSLDTCILQYEGVNTTVTCLDNSTSINITNSVNRSLIFFANDSFGNVNSSTVTWNYRLFLNSQTFTSSIIEGASSTFTINLTTNGTDITIGNLSYNNTQNIGGLSITGNQFVISKSITAPDVSTDTNISFFWNITQSDGVFFALTPQNQTVLALGIDNCSTNTILILNYTLRDEGTQDFLNVSADNISVEIDVKIFTSDGSLQVLNFSELYTDINPTQVCLNINLTTENYQLDATNKYTSDPREIEYHNIQGFNLTNSSIPQNIILFDLLTADSTEFQITFKDSSFVVVEDALINVNRQYVSEGVFKTVELPKTDSNGQTVVHLVEKDIVYNFIVIKNGILLGTFNNLIAFCDDATTGACFITLNALGANTQPFNYDESIQLFSSFDYNQTSRVLQFTFVTTDGTSKNVSLNTIKMDQLGNTTACGQTLISSSGTLTCTIPDSFGNETIITNIFVDGTLTITNYIRAASPFDIGDIGYFLAWFLILSLALMFSESKIGTVIGVLMGVIVSILFAWLEGGLIGVGSAFMWLVIAGFILIWKLNKDRIT